jgi:hypothetical protein
MTAISIPKRSARIFVSGNIPDLSLPFIRVPDDEIMENRMQFFAKEVERTP